MMEYNSNFELDEAKSILPPADGETWVETHVKLIRLCHKAMILNQEHKNKTKSWKRWDHNKDQDLY